MAKFGNKLFGKIGDVVIAHWKGKPYIRSRPSENPSNTKAQQNQRSKFSMVVKFVGQILPVINAGFKWNIDRMTERNAAISYLMKNTVKGEKPEIRIDYKRVLVSRGNLPAPQEATAERTSGNNLLICWNFNTKLINKRATDKVLALAYFPEVMQGVWSINGSAIRKDEEITLELPESTAEKELHVYLGFAAPDGKDASDSAYATLEK